MRRRDVSTALLATVLCLAAAVAIAGDESAAVSVQQGPCCFENPRYSGTCEVTPDEGESCGSILAYLNNPNSVGKDYCGNTTIRGGWSQVECETPTSVEDRCTGDRATPQE